MTERKRRRLWLLPMPAVLVIAVLSGLLVVQSKSGVRVTIQNTGSSALKLVVLHVTGASYKLGDIAVGESVTMRVDPTSESHLEVEFTDIDGQVQRVNGGGYFESGYRGTIRVEIKDGQIDKFEEDIKLW
jgi:hypothetical protein